MANKSAQEEIINYLAEAVGATDEQSLAQNVKEQLGVDLNNKEQVQALMQTIAQAMKQGIPANQFVKALQQSQKASKGAKLLYLAELLGKCPKGYMKKGGKVGCDCVKIEKDKCGDKLKKDCGGSKIAMKKCGGKKWTPKKK